MWNMSGFSSVVSPRCVYTLVFRVLSRTVGSSSPNVVVKTILANVISLLSPAQPVSLTSCNIVFIIKQRSYMFTLLFIVNTIISYGLNM